MLPESYGPVSPDAASDVSGRSAISGQWRRWRSLNLRAAILLQAIAATVWFACQFRRLTSGAPLLGSVSLAPGGQDLLPAGASRPWLHGQVTIWLATLAGMLLLAAGAPGSPPPLCQVASREEVRHG